MSKILYSSDFVILSVSDVPTSRAYPRLYEVQTPDYRETVVLPAAEAKAVAVAILENEKQYAVS